MRRKVVSRLVGIVLAVLPVSAFAAIVPFSEDFVADSANWFDNTGGSPLGWSPAGGPDGSSHAFGTFNFVNSAANDPPVMFRAQDKFGSSGGAFEGTWLSVRVAEFSVFVKHDAGIPLTFFVRFATPMNFPGGIALEFVPVPSGTWTQIRVQIDPDNPQFIIFKGTDFHTLFSNIGHVQIGVFVPEALAGVDQTFTFSVDKPTLAPSTTVIPFLEDFVVNSACWFDNSGASPLGWSPAGGPDGSSHALGTFNFVNSQANDSPVMFRAQDEFGSSGGAFVRDWISDRVGEFSVFVKHDAGIPLTFFVRFATPFNFPGGIALEFVPVPSETWTQIRISIDPDNPQFIIFKGTDFDTLFSNIGHVQIGVSVPGALAGVDQTFTFSVDKATLVRSLAAVPTTSEWGVMAMSMLMLTSGTIFVRRRFARSTGPEGASGSGEIR